jgi:hypothetical protein
VELAVNRANWGRLVNHLPSTSGQYLPTSAGNPAFLLKKRKGIHVSSKKATKKKARKQMDAIILSESEQETSEEESVSVVFTDASEDSITQDSSEDSVTQEEDSEDEKVSIFLLLMVFLGNSKFKEFKVHAQGSCLCFWY